MKGSIQAKICAAFWARFALSGLLKLAVQWTKPSRPAVPQRPRFSLCVPSSPASRPYKTCFAWVQTPSRSLRKSLCCFWKYNIQSNRNQILRIWVDRNWKYFQMEINDTENRTRQSLRFRLEKAKKCFYFYLKKNLQSVNCTTNHVSSGLLAVSLYYFNGRFFDMLIISAVFKITPKE